MTKYPKCRFCGQELGEAWVFKRTSGEPLYLCDDCFGLIGAVAHDNVFRIFEDLKRITTLENEP